MKKRKLSLRSLHKYLSERMKSVQDDLAEAQQNLMETPEFVELMECQKAHAWVEAYSNLIGLIKREFK